MSFISNLVVLECGGELFVLLNVLLNVTDEFHIQLSCVGVWERVICVVKCH